MLARSPRQQPRLSPLDDCARLIRAPDLDLVHTTLFESDVAGRVAAARSCVPVASSLVNASYGHEHHEDPKLRGWQLRSAQLIDIARLPTAATPPILAGRGPLPTSERTQPAPDIRRCLVHPPGRRPRQIQRQPTSLGTSRAPERR